MRAALAGRSANQVAPAWQVSSFKRSIGHNNSRPRAGLKRAASNSSLRQLSRSGSAGSAQSLATITGCFKPA